MKNLPYALLAIGLSVFCWFLVTGRERVETWVKVRVEISGAPKGLDITGLVQFIEARVRGPRGALLNIEPGPLGYALDLHDLKPGNTELTLSARAISLPPTLEVLELRPSRLVVNAQRRVIKKLPIEAVFLPPGNPDYKIVEKKIEPDMIEAGGPESVMSDLGALRAPVSWPADPANAFEEQVQIEPIQGVELQPQSVRVTARFAALPRQVEFEIPLTVTGLAQNRYQATPTVVRIGLEAPAPMVRRGALKERIEAVLSAQANLRPGKYVLPYKVKMPPGCRLIEAKPEKIVLTVK